MPPPACQSGCVPAPAAAACRAPLPAVAPARVTPQTIARQPSSASASRAIRENHGIAAMANAPCQKILTLSGPRPRHLGLLAGDEFQQHRDAFLGLLDAAPDRGNDVFRFCHALAMAAEGARHRRVVAGD